MASKFLHEAQRGAGSGSIDLPLAMVAALSVGFVAFMLPADILARLVEMSRLPEFVPAAAPPLGTKAQAAFAAAAAGATLAAVYFLLQLLGRKRPEPKAQIWPEMDTEREPEMPRLRRSDIHPDAPARRPILAARDLGEPEPSPAPVPPQQEAPAESEAVGEAPEEEALELGGPGTEMIEADPEPVTVAETPVEQLPIEQPHLAQPVEPAPRPADFEPAGDSSIADLMERLERGLARRAGQKAAPFAAQVEPVVEAAAPASAPHAEEWSDDRLRSAIENLQKMAARAG